MSRPLVGEQAGLEDYTVTQYLFIYSPCRVWGWGDGVSHPASLPYALGGPKTPSSGSSLWRPPSRDIVGPKVVLNALGLPTCLWVCPLFSPKPLLGDLSDQTDRSQKHKGSHPSLTGQRHGSMELASLWCSPCGGACAGSGRGC